MYDHQTEDTIEVVREFMHEFQKRHQLQVPSNDILLAGMGLDESAGQASDTPELPSREPEVAEHFRRHHKQRVLRVFCDSPEAAHCLCRYRVFVEDVAPLQILVLAPYIGCAIAEYLRDSAKHAVTHYDLSKQAVAFPK